jgi:MoaA/NifB/PqqE/SkfB family radical SAM enzyme
MEPPDAPRPSRHYAMWMFTAACPSHCTYCDIDSQKGKKGLSREEVVRVAEEIVEQGFSEVMFVGGEPLLSPDLPAALRALGGRVKTAVFTGGVPGLVDRAVEVLGEGGVDRVVFSIDSGQPNRNDLIRGRKGITQDLVDLAAAVHERLPNIDRSVNTVVSRYNVRALAGVWQRMSPYGLTSWSLTLAGDVFSGSPGHALIDVPSLEELYFKTIPVLAAHLARSGAELVVLPIPYPLLAARVPPARWGQLGPAARAEVALELEKLSRGEHNATFVEKHGCPLVGIDVVIGVGGEVHPCSQGPIIHPSYVVGNVKTHSLGEILHGEALRAFAGGVPHAPCTRCWAPSNVPRETLLQLTGARHEGRSA